MECLHFHSHVNFEAESLSSASVHVILLKNHFQGTVVGALLGAQTPAL